MSYGDWEEWRKRRRKNRGSTVGYGGDPLRGLMPDDHPWRAAHLAQMWDPPPQSDNIRTAIDMARRTAQAIAERRAG